VLQLGRKVADGDRFGIGTGEGPSKGDCASYKVKIYNHYTDENVELEVPEDRSAHHTGSSQCTAQHSHCLLLLNEQGLAKSNGKSTGSNG
jgi:hypothetical protein